MNQALPTLTRVADYQIEQLIGQGSFARVYAARNTLDIRRPKRALLELIVQGDAEERKLRERTFKRTAEILEKLNHPSIPRAYCLFERDDTFYLVQEFIDGINYSEYFDGKKYPLSITEIERVFEEVLEGLAELHRAKIVHRDIKPSNLMRRNTDNSTVIVDFGSACDLSALDALETVLGNSNQKLGSTQIYTPGYAHPEQRDGLVPATFQWDLYALAKTVVALRLGVNPPWNQPWSVEDLGFSQKVEKLLKEMLKTEGCQLVDACDALKFEPEPIQLSKTSVSSLPYITSTKRGSRNRSWYMLAGGITMLAVAVTGAYFFLLPKYINLSQDQQKLQVPQCPNYVKSNLNLPVPDSGFAARFYYPETIVAGGSTLEIWRDGKLLARANDNIRGFIWIKSLANGSNFPPGNYQMRLLVPESIPYETEVALDPDFPFYYLGNAAALKVVCAVQVEPQTS